MAQLAICPGQVGQILLAEVVDLCFGLGSHPVQERGLVVTYKQSSFSLHMSQLT